MAVNERHDEFMRRFLSCEPRLYAFIRSLLFSRADADDVLQETALVLWEKFDQFERGTHFDRWAYRVAHLQVMYYRQKKARDRLQFSDGLIERLATEVASESDRLEDVHSALSGCLQDLPAPDRDLVRQRYNPLSTNRDVARLMGKSESAISRSLNRVYAALLLCIEGKMAVDGRRAAS
jgi:RNA polymerase sigma-70 factor (ECF subfamily)